MCGRVLVSRPAGLAQRLFQQRVVGRKELHGHTLDVHTFALLRIPSAAQGLVERRKRNQSACGLRQHDEHIQVEGQQRLDVERRTHRAPDGVTAQHARAFQFVENFEGALHWLEGARTALSASWGESSVRADRAVRAPSCSSFAPRMEHAASQIQDSRDLSGVSGTDARVTKRAAVAKRELRPTAYGRGTVWWGEATDEPARADARPTENANCTTTRLT